MRDSDLLVPKSVVRRVIEIRGRDGIVLITDSDNTDKGDDNDPSYPGNKKGQGYPSTENHGAGHWIFEERHGFLSTAVEIIYIPREPKRTYLICADAIEPP